MRGRELFEAQCVVCHSIGAGRIVGPDLKRIATKYDRTTVLQWIQDPDGLYKERGRRPLKPGFEAMPASRVSRDDAEAITEFLLASAGRE